MMGETVARRVLVLLLGLGLPVSAHAGFGYRKPLTIDGSQVQGGPHLDFPVLVSLIDPDLRLVASGGRVTSPQGYDIGFRAADATTVLDWEVERYDGTTGTLVAWVRFPGTAGPPDTRIQNGVSTQFYLYYGDPEITCCQARHGTVWDANYREVFHLKETTGNPVDSTTNGVGSRINPNGDTGASEARGVVSPAPTHLSPIGGGSIDLMNPPTTPPPIFQADTDTHLALADGTLAANASFTVEAWFYMDVLNAGYVGIVTKNRDSGVDWIGLFKTDAAGGHLLTSGWQCCAPNRPGNLDGPSLVAGRWYHAAATYDTATTTRRLYVDGVQVATDTVGALYTALANPTRVGDDSNGNYMDGRVDEVRLSTVERSAGWIGTTARNQSCASASLPAPACTAPLPYTTPFLSAGAEESLGPSASTGDCCKVTTSVAGSQTTVETSDLRMVFDVNEGAGLSEVYTEEEANSSVNRRGDGARYNVFSTQVNDAGGWHFERDGAGTLQVLESTSVRTKLRQLYDYTASLHLDRTWSLYSYPRAAIDETFVLDSTQDIRGAQGLHPKGETACADTAFGNTFFCAGVSDGTNRFWLVTDNQNTYGDMLAVIYNNTFFGRVGAGGVYQQMFEAGTPNTYFARVWESTQISTLVSANRYFYLFYPRLAGLASTGTAWQPYADDYRTPASLSASIGSAWSDASENTSFGDDYNQAEAAYLLTADPTQPATVLRFDISGSVASPRFKPFFKFRQWRSLSGPTSVTLEGSPLTRNGGYRAEVKPFARAFLCTPGCAALANGGLAGATEFLADSSAGKNATLNLAGANFLYLGSDSKFLGINVALATYGAGTATLRWEYWNGSVWTSVGAIADQTNNLTRNGTVYWPVEPAGWSTTSVGGSPLLYYVRASLFSGSYTTLPVEGLMKTDILLFQYCGDIVAPNMTFDIGAPVPTAVTLQSFTASGTDSSVDLHWSTASELQNLGFHLYRSLSADGPYERITSSLIPGLGSSPTGASYSYRDGGLQNGETYYYELEDVETTGRTARHGPVWATPSPAAETGPGEGDDAGSGSEGSDQGSPTARIAYGQPEAASFRVVERGRSHALLELWTPGFYAVPEEDGSVRLEVPGFESRVVPGAPDVPVKRALVEAMAGRKVRLGSVVAREEVRFEGLRVAPAGAPAVVVGEQGTVKPGVAKKSVRSRPGLFPRARARILEVIFQGETKKARVELAPLRHDPARGETVLTQRLLVRLDFTGVEKGERTLGGSRGRRPPRVPPLRSRGLLAQLATSQAGLHGVRYEEVLANPRGVLVSSLRLSRRGQDVAFHVEPDRALFAPGSVLYFLNEGSTANPWGDSVYELELSNAGTRMPVSSGPPSGPLTTEYLDFKEWEQNRFYQAGLLEAPDLWLWDLLVSPAAKSYPFTLSEVSSSSTPAHLEVILQGASDFEADPDHHLRVHLNGQVVGEATWDGKVEKVIEADLGPGILQEGQNTLSLENVGDTAASYSMVFLNRFSLSYPRHIVAEQGVLRGEWTESGTAAVTGLGGAGFVLDVEDSLPRWLSGVEATSSDLSFRAEGGRKYLVTSPAAVNTPLIRRPVPSRLGNPQQGTEWLLVAPRELLAAAQPLLELRQRQGLKAKAVSLEEVEQEFGDGEHSPSALKAFLEYAYQGWPKPTLRYVVLLGDGSYDPKDYLKTGVKDRISPYILETSYLWTASDPAYAAVNGEDLVPDLAVGRLPAGSLEQAQALVDKIVAFETAGRNLDGRAVLVADNADLGGSFEADADEIASSVLSQREVEKVYLRDLQGGTRATIVAAFDNGPSLVSYVGHGGTAVWASENVFNNTDVSALSPQAQQPLLLTMNCLNGFFHFPPLDSLAEAFLKAEGKGAISAFSPSGLSVNDAAHLYHKALLSEIESGRHARVGDALLAAQSAYADSGAMPELLSIYHFFGDPALKIR